jgi:hypothetical protein
MYALIPPDPCTKCITIVYVNLIRKSFALFSTTTKLKATNSLGVAALGATCINNALI